MFLVRLHRAWIVQCILVTVLLQRDAISGQDQTQQQPTLAPVAQVISELPPCSELRQELEQGKRGSGVEQPYMSAMRHAGVKRAFFVVRSIWHGHGPEELRVSRRLFFSRLDGPDAEMTDPARLQLLMSGGLTAALDEVAFEQVKQAPYFNGIDGGGPRGGQQMWSNVELFSDPRIPKPRVIVAPLPRLDPLVDASLAGDILAVQQQLSRGKPPTRKLNYALLQAVLSRYDNNAVIKLLVQAGADVNFHGHDGITPLMNAVPHPCNLKSLLELGARPQEADKWGKTALQLAREEKQTESIKLLLAYSSRK